MTLKPWHWIAMVLTTGGLVVMAPSDDAEVSKKGARPVKAASGSKPSETSGSSAPDRQVAIEGERVELELLAKLDLQHKEKVKVSDVFNQTSWYVPPPPPPKSLEPPPPPPPPPAPVAPQLPFTYLGRYGDSDTRTVILSKGEKVYTVTVGETIENTYRVEKFSPGIVTLTYLPLNIVQSLRTGEAL
jgi:hypothetical protein